MRELFLIVGAVFASASGCAGSPAAPAAPTVPPTSDEGLLAHTWIVADHLLVKGASISEADAAGFQGRTVDVSTTGYNSPWQGACEDATRKRRPRRLEGVMIELEVAPENRPAVTAFGLGDQVFEFRLTCNDRRMPPPLVIYVGNEKAMTCFGGACYLMNRF